MVVRLANPLDQPAIPGISVASFGEHAGAPFQFAIVGDRAVCAPDVPRTKIEELHSARLRRYKIWARLDDKVSHPVGGNPVRHVKQHTMESFNFVFPRFVCDNPAILSQHTVVESKMNVGNGDERRLARGGWQLLEVTEQDHVDRTVPRTRHEPLSELKSMVTRDSKIASLNSEDAGH